MRVALVALGSAGDVFPTLGIAIELQRRGHQVKVFSNRFFEPQVTGVGLDFEAVAEVEAFEDSRRLEAFWSRPRLLQLPRYWRRSLELSTLEPMRPTLAALSAYRPALVTAPGWAFGARLGNELGRWNLATLHLEPFWIRSNQRDCLMPPLRMRGVPRWLRALQFWLLDKLFLDPLLAPDFNRFRAELGLGRCRRATHRWWHSEQLVVGLFPEWFCPRPGDWPDAFVHGGFVRWTPPTPVNERLEAFLAAGTEPVVFVPGSENAHAGSFFNAAKRALQQIGRRGLFVTRFAEQVGELPPTIERFDFIDFPAVLPRCAALVHNAMLGTMAQGIAAAIPQLLAPLAHAQPDNANLLVRAGAALTLPSRYSFETLAGRLRAALNLPAARRSELSTRVNQNHAAARIADKLEKLA